MTLAKWILGLILVACLSEQGFAKHYCLQTKTGLECDYHSLQNCERDSDLNKGEFCIYKPDYLSDKQDENHLVIGGVPICINGSYGDACLHYTQESCTELERRDGNIKCEDY